MVQNESLFNSPDLEISIVAHYCTCLFHLITEMTKLGKMKEPLQFRHKVLFAEFTFSNNIKFVDNIYIHSETTLKGIDSDNKNSFIEGHYGDNYISLETINGKIRIHTALVLGFMFVYDNSDN